MKPELSSESLRLRAHELIPGGCHTYAKGDDQFPEERAALHRARQRLPRLGRGRPGVHRVRHGPARRDARARLRAGRRRGAAHARRRDQLHPAGADRGRVRRDASCGSCRAREMVKFCKDGSHAVDGAVRLARAHTGRDMIAICGDHPFFSTSDWFIGTTDMAAGIPESTRRQVVKFRYHDLPSLEALFRAAPREDRLRGHGAGAHRGTAARLPRRASRRSRTRTARCWCSTR